MTKQIVFINPTVQDQQILLQGIDPAIEIVHLDDNQDGLKQIADHMTKQREVDAIHIICHGAPGTLHLGSAVVTPDNLKFYTVALAHVGRALSEGGDILVYGCEAAAGERGATLIEQFARLTGANVASSTARVGLGNWALEG